MATQQLQPNYILYGYLDLLAQIQSVLAQYPQWVDLYESSTGTVLMEFYAFVANIVLYYLERTAEEVYLPTAQRKSSIINIVSLLNYTPSRNVSATGNVTFTLSSPAVNAITIPAKFRIQTSTGYYYNLVNPITIFPGQTSVVASVIEGQWISLNFTSNGGVNQTYPVSDITIENNNYIVTDNGTVWTPVSSFLSSFANSQVYRLITNLDGTVTFAFGDNINGQAPNNGDDIVISYISSDGLNGNVYSGGINWVQIDTITDSQGNVINNTVISNSSSLLGGANAETAQEIAYNGPQVFSTGNRFVTKADGIAIVQNYNASIGSVNVWGEAENFPPNYNMYNQAIISMILQGPGTTWVTASSSFKTALSTYLYNLCPLGLRISYQDPTVIQVVPIITVYVAQGYSTSSVQANIEIALAEQFQLGVTSIIGQNIRYANIVTAIQAVLGVSYCYLTLQASQQMTYHLTSGNNYGTVLNLLPIKAGSVAVFVGTTKVGIDNGVGGFTSIASGYNFTSSTINYTTGVVNISFSPTISSSSNVTLNYQQNQNGDLVVSNSQILQYTPNSAIYTLNLV